MRPDKADWAVLSPLLDELLDADETQREIRLEELRRRDPARAERLSQLLAAVPEIQRQGFLDGSVLDVADAPPILQRAGTTIGGYRLERQLGQGGMGSVWLAHRSDGRFEGKAAVKFLDLALVARGGAERFQREGNVLARLEHPNIARLLDAGLNGTQPFLVLEYVDGQPIDRWCNDHSLGVQQRVRLMLDVSAAVAHAHQNLVLHRDLKPSNRASKVLRAFAFFFSAATRSSGGAVAGFGALRFVGDFTPSRLSCIAFLMCAMRVFFGGSSLIDVSLP